ncbi:DNA repair exonuclease subunit 1 protein [Rhizobium phage RHph_N1_15]|nr:DNA repair exonuclease subunit 1 protein [Rhizobium phage RHph_N1_10]QIG69298.1 DNA repair exonuclease subunit 1 protein [Rhizobium phage RHph_N1_15]QIG75158.1 DNA repair exonuclease subunit 1 protein [Rhizobium phage RHph_N2_6]
MSYVIISDLHAHKWSTFSTFTADGVNSRLQIILDELTRAAQHAKKIGAEFIVCAGDIMHVRGSIDPEVLNPLQERIKEILDMGLDIYAIPGNHDLAGKDTTVLGNAINTLAQTKSDHGVFTVYNEPRGVTRNGHRIAMVPYRMTTELLLKDLAELAKHPHRDEMDVFIHAGIDGVLIGVQPHGLTGEMLADFGFRNVFAGDYHHHKEVVPGVWSIGATTHQRWNDVGTKAGFMSVDDAGKAVYHATHAPRFVDVSGLDETDMALAADGNYVRFSGPEMTGAEITELRQFLLDSNAKGVVIMAPKKVAPTARGGKPKTGAVTVDESVASYVDGATDISTLVDRERLKRECADVLNAARAVTEDA